VLFYPLFVVRVKIIKMYDCIFSRAWAFFGDGCKFIRKEPYYKTACLWVLLFFVRCICCCFLSWVIASLQMIIRDRRERERVEIDWDRVVLKTRNWDICVKIFKKFKLSKLDNLNKYILFQNLLAYLFIIPCPVSASFYQNLDTNISISCF
jgi:hypothetical protein